MGEWGAALLFGLTLTAFVLGLSSLIMGFLPQSAEAEGSPMRNKIEYGFFGAAGLVLCILFAYGLSTI